MSTTDIDPITLEVLRHRLWMINDEQGRVASQVSGSPVVYEAKDFNTSLLTPEGDSLFVGIYTTRLSLCLNFAVKAVIERLGETVGIEDGDAFVTNDPWAGAAHMNDILMVAPIFWQGALVCWTGLAMHEVDVGGPNPGSFTVGTPNVFGEGPLIPPVKMVERGRIRDDIEAWVIRNSRTSTLNGLNMRARVAAINRTRERIHEVIEEYGLATFMKVQERVLALVGESFARRLRTLPDGTWKADGILDHDGNDNVLYRIRLAMTKVDDRLTFDFTGTDGQAPGAINCTRVGLESGVVSAILPMLCYDIPWSPGGLMPHIAFVSKEGAINNARHPAAVSMATVAATFATQHVASACIGKMLACSELADEAQANWTAAWQGATMAGHHDDGRPFTAVLLDQSGGGGALAWKDGPDTGGLPGTPAMGIANVETYEREYPLLYVYRRQATDTGGAGRWRGGVGTEAMVIPHRNRGPIDLTVLTHGASQPEAQGLYGGYPSSVQVRLLLRGSEIRERFARREIPTDIDPTGVNGLEPLAAKQRTLVQPDDAIIMACAGGGGFGDPIAREPERVRLDVERGLCSADVAKRIYGVVLNGEVAPEVDEAATDAARADIRARRLTEGRPVDAASPGGSSNDTAPETSIEIGSALRLTSHDGEHRFRCACCDHVLSTQDNDPKRGALARELRIDEISQWNRYGLTDEIVVREFCCPSCASLIGVEVRHRDDPVLLDTHLGRAHAREAAE